MLTELFAKLGQAIVNAYIRYSSCQCLTWSVTKLNIVVILQDYNINSYFHSL